MANIESQPARKPRVSIGMPVYNAERYLPFALNSLLGQTFDDFEIVISDNASTDGTEGICRGYAERDERIVYRRNDENIGVSANYRRVFQLANGRYFKWAAHDDAWSANMLETCVAVLDARPEVVLAYPCMDLIDEEGRVVDRHDIHPSTDVPSPHQRFYRLVRYRTRMPQIHGVMRSSALRATPLIGDYASSDVTLIAWLSLLGRFHEIPDYLVHCRVHTEQLMALTRHQRMSHFRPSDGARLTFPEWRLYVEFYRPVLQVPLPWSERLWCLLYLLCWPAWHRNWRRLGKDLITAGLQLAYALRQSG